LYRKRGCPNKKGLTQIERTGETGLTRGGSISHERRKGQKETKIGGEQSGSRGARTHEKFKKTVCKPTQETDFCDGFNGRGWGGENKPHQEKGTAVNEVLDLPFG